MTHVALRHLPLDHGDVIHAVSVARAVASVGRRESANRSITAITDDLDLVKVLTENSSRHYDAGLSGCAYWYGGRIVIWLNPMYAGPLYASAQRRVISTLSHELAHALGHTTVLHGRPFRRLHTCIVTLVGTVFGEFFLPFNEAQRVSLLYARYKTYESSNARRIRVDLEARSHEIAAYRTFDRLGHLVR